MNKLNLNPKETTIIADLLEKRIRKMEKILNTLSKHHATKAFNAYQEEYHDAIILIEKLANNLGYQYAVKSDENGKFLFFMEPYDDRTEDD